MNRFGYAIVLTLICHAASVSAAETYIIPIWGHQLPGATGTYTSVLSMTNVGNEPSIATVVDVVPIVTEPCVSLCRDSEWRIEPHRTLVVSDQGSLDIYFSGRHLIYGAVVLRSTLPLHVESEIYRTNSDVVEQWQTVQVANEWLTTRSVIPRAIPDPFVISTSPRGSETFKLYFVNPNDFAMRFDYSTHDGGRGATTVAGRSIGVIELPASFFCAGTCTGVEHPTGSAYEVEVMANFPYIAASSTSSRNLPGVVHVALAEP